VIARADDKAACIKADTTTPDNISVKMDVGAGNSKDGSCRRYDGQYLSNYSLPVPQDAVLVRSRLVEIISQANVTSFEWNKKVS
jgi:hypothetical protein